MKIEQRFTATGAAGVLLLFVGPLVSAVGYWFWISSMARNIQFGTYLYSDPWPSIIAMTVGGFLSLASLPMMIVGREFEGFSEAGARKEPSGL